MTAGYRRRLLTNACAFLAMPAAAALAADEAPLNLAPAATPRTSFVSEHETLSAIGDGFAPRNSRDHSHGAYGNWPQRDPQWIEYEWPKPISANAAAVYWWDDRQGVGLPKSARLSYWDGKSFVPIDAAVGVQANTFSRVSFPTIETTRLRLEITPGEKSTGVLEFQVFDAGNSPAFPPKAIAGHDRIAVLPSPTYLEGTGVAVKRASDLATGSWSKLSGPGEVSFQHANQANTAATFAAPGDYVLQFTYGARGLTSNDTVNVHVEPKPQAAKLNAVYVSNWQVSSPFWRDRLKAQIVHWIPHCVAMIDDPNLKEGGINNIIEAGKKLRGEPSKPHVGYPFSNAWVLNTTESMCVALTLDPQGDPEIIKSQDAFRAKLEEWIPLILAAQEPDGYFQTRFTLATSSERQRNVTPQHWNPPTRGEHEGYVAGYFIEMGIAHHIATGGKDRRLFDAALKLADCWVANLGPGKKAWYDGHQEVEQALVRLGRYVNDLSAEQGGGAGKGQKYIDLAKFLLDSRSRTGSAAAVAQASGDDFYLGSGQGSEYDQSHRPIEAQYTAVGHAVRAAYTYSAVADVAMETGDAGYWSAIRSIWDDLVNRKYYVTGGIGSGETSEGFGPDYSLPVNAYAESCSGTGILFMQYKLNLATRDAKYADLYETSLFNAILGDVDLAGENFTYTNSLDSNQARYKWHNCPCCVGNIPRTLLMLPTWTYATASDAVYVNLFAGAKVNVGKVGGASVEMIQETNYPWDGDVKLMVNPSSPAEFTVNVRSPRREISTLYTATPSGDGIESIAVNGEKIDATPDASGYVAIKRQWKAGDVVAFRLPLPVQVITPSDKIAAIRGKVALRRGPLIYNLEAADQQDVAKPVSSGSAFTAAWMPGLLGGVRQIRGSFADGSPLVAVPNYARLNRGGRSLIWMNRQP